MTSIVLSHELSISLHARNALLEYPYLFIFALLLIITLLLLFLIRLQLFRTIIVAQIERNVPFKVILVSVAISKPIILPSSFTIPLLSISTSTLLCHSTTPCKVAQPSAFVLVASPSIISRQRVASQFILVCFTCRASSSGTLPL